MKRIEIVRPFNAHVHLRRGTILNDVIGYTANICGHAVLMSNFLPPVDDLNLLLEYEQEVEEASRPWPLFSPVMVIMLTPRVTVETIKLCAPNAKVLKLIPANTSTNSQAGVSLENIENYYNVLEEVRNQNMIFSVHAEKMTDKNGNNIPEAKREKAALPILEKIVHDIPGLKIIMEHVSTKEGVDFVLSCPNNVVGTVTAHHIYFSDVYLYDSHRLIPEFYCKPVLKAWEHRQAVELIVLRGSKKFFYGSDSAPHPWNKKFETDPPAAGIFSEPVAISLIAETFDRQNSLHQLENFLSLAGREFYGLTIPNQKIAIYNDGEDWQVPETVGKDNIPVLMGGKSLSWKIEQIHKQP